MSTFIERVIAEKSELDERIDKLNAFVASENFSKIAPTQKALLRIQAHAMDTYSRVLAERLENIEETTSATIDN